VLRRAGVRVDSSPPPSGMMDGDLVPRGPMPSLPAAPMPLLVKAQARTNLGQPVGAQTRTAWDTAGVQGPRSGARTRLMVGGLALLVGAGVFAALRLRHPVDAVPAQADPPVTTAVTQTEPTTPTVVIAQPSVAAGTTPAPTASSTVSSAPPVTMGGTPMPPVHGRGGHVPKSGVPVTAPTAAVAPVKPTKPAEDTDGFGDRK
jgi:hypothetical protein